MNRHGFVGRGGLKLRHALDEFRIDVAGLNCADFGCNVGGFTDCLLQAGAARVFALDTGYGMLAWTLRNDPRVVVMERTSALHAPPPEGGVDLVAVDMGWTPQRSCIPAALRWLAPGSAGRIVTLIKPHYEATAMGESLPHGGILPEDRAQRTVEQVIGSLGGFCVVEAVTRSPIAGGAGKGRAGPGNTEWLALLRPRSP